MFTSNKPTLTLILGFVCIVALAGVGFSFGWFLSGKQVASLSTSDGPPPSATTSKQETTLPVSDVDGEDLAALPRYPGSVRVAHHKSSLGEGVILTKVSYVTDARRDEVKDFYRGVFRSGEWTVGDLEFSDGEWNFLVIDDERQAHVEIESEADELVYVSIRLEEPAQEQRAPNEGISSPRSGGATSPESRTVPSPDYTPPADENEAEYEDDYYDDYEDDYGDSEIPDDSEGPDGYDEPENGD